MSKSQLNHISEEIPDFWKLQDSVWKLTYGSALADAPGEARHIPKVADIRLRVILCWNILPHNEQRPVYQLL